MKTSLKIDQALLNCIPMNWLDPLLTGDDKVISSQVGTYNCQDIERLLSAIRERMEHVLIPNKRHIK